MRKHHPYEPPRDNRPPKDWAGSAHHFRIRFELLEELTPGDTVAVKVRIYDRLTNEYKTTEMETEVTDAEGMYEGQQGDYGRAEWWPDSGKFEIYQLQCRTGV